MKRLFINFILFFFLTRCAVIKETGRTDLLILDKNNIQNLNSLYSNIPVDTVTNSDPIFKSLWHKISYFRYDRKRHPSWKVQSIKLEVITNTRIRASLYLGDSLIKQRNIRGKVKGGYFYKRPSFIVFPFFPLFCGYSTTRYRFGLAENHLVVDYRDHFWIYTFIAGNSDNYQVPETYIRKTK